MRGWQTMIRLEDVSGTAGSKRQPRFFPGGGGRGRLRGWGPGINRHGQHIPKVDKLSQIKSCLQEGIWGIMVQWRFIYLWPHFALAEVIVTLPPGGEGGGGVRDCECASVREETARVCVCVRLQYLHEAAAFSFSADKKPRGDTGDLKTEGGKKKAKQRG